MSVKRIPTANQKIVSVNDAMGVKGIGKQQGTTRIIYDSVKLNTSANSTTVTLFKDCKTRQYPYTNLSENKLQVGESIAMQRFSIFILEVAAGTNNPLGTLPLAYFPAFSRLYRSDMNFNIAQNQVIKQLPLHSMYAPFNHKSKFYGESQFQPAGGDLNSFQIPQDVYEFDNPIIIPPQIEFYSEIIIPAVTVPAGFDFYLMMNIEGLGSLFSPKSNY